MIKKIVAIGVALSILLLTPARAYACSGWIDCLFGFTERTSVRADRDVDTARINAEKDRQVAEIEAEAQRKITEANQELERIANARFADEQQAKIAIANAQAQRDITIKTIDSWLNERVNVIESQQAVAVAGVQAQANIAIAGITETGATERSKDTNSAWSFASIVLVAIIAALAIINMRHKQRMLLLEQMRQQEQLPYAHSAPVDWRVVKNEVIYYDNSKS
jgi:hypothetical protein